MPKLSQYEIDRANNIKKNNALLASLDIHKDIFPPKEVQRPKKIAAPKKRKAEVNENDDASVGSPPKIARTDTGDELLSGARRSARNAGKKVDYRAEQVRSIPTPVSTRNKPGNQGPLGSGASTRKMCVYLFNMMPLYSLREL
jgi:E3 ubiquitin-protein ligase UHRF1